jgi:hypothetical protein
MPVILTTTVLVLPGYISNLGLLPQLNLSIGNIGLIGKLFTLHLILV